MDRPVFIIYLQPQSGIDDMRALKALLKTALQHHRLKCIRLTTYDPSSSSRRAMQREYGR
jgi:hypothetical protein